jgi:hypothetical protein
MATVEEKLAAAKATRKLAADSLHQALTELLPGSDPISEVRLRDRWLAIMRESGRVYDDGWYMPPPHGMAVLFSTDENINRTNFDVLRPEPIWPRDDIFLDRERGIIMVYASPVDKPSHMIGDFEMMLYFGDNKSIQGHFASVLRLDFEVFQKVSLGMTLAEVTALAESFMDKLGLVNNVVSINDPAGTNIGHTVPSTDEDWTPEENAVFTQNDWSKSLDVIAKKRRFVNKLEALKVRQGLGFNIEPRPLAKDDSSMPMASFHTTVLVHEDGNKELLTNFDELFKLAGMDYMPKEPLD